MKLFVQKYTSDLLVATRKWEIPDLKYRHNDDNGAVLKQASIRMITSEMLLCRERRDMHTQFWKENLK
jgi:hypothetical protein